MAKGKMKAWYDDIDAATLQRIKTYSAFNDATSKNLMMQTMYEYREKEIQDFKETNHELAETCIARKKRIAELERKISVLLSCQNCPDNKGGLLCQKEYEDKCLAQKIQYIKELLEENAELKEKLNFSTQYYRGEKAREQLTKAKEIILKLYNAGRDVLMCRAEEKAYTRLDNAINDKRIEQFLKEVSE